jgi:hypothetical protein
MIFAILFAQDEWLYVGWIQMLSFILYCIGLYTYNQIRKIVILIFEFIIWCHFDP